MVGTRQLIEAFGGWQSCEDPSAVDGKATEQGTGAANPELNRAMLGRTIESEVIPRLMLAHRRAPSIARSRLPQAQHVGPDDVRELARIVIQHDTEVAASYVEALRNQGVPVEAIYLELLAPTARHLGEMWKSDECCFTDVTLGISRLQQVVHELSPDFERETAPTFEGRRILLITMPGEQHTLGLMLVEEYFRRSGWDCCSSTPKDTADMIRLVKGQHFDVVGISVSWGELIDSIALTVQTMRKASLNKAVAILVGGPFFADKPEYVARVGADGTAQDGRHAVMLLRSLLAAQITGS